jgi:DtxR family Mn-dependent transcriptional regulator
MAKKNKDTQSTESVENFLKAVYSLEQRMASDEDRVSTNALSEMLSISAPSVTDMAQRLVDEGLIDYQRYRGIRLTDQGAGIALKMLRRHRLIELFLVKELGYELHEVHAEAENLEHAVSDQFVQALAAKLGHPSFDPHGDPIPNAEGVMVAPTLLPLSELPIHQQAQVSRFAAEDNALLQYTLSKGFKLRSDVEVIARDPFEGPLTVVIDGSTMVIGHTMAQNILVEPQ